MTLAAGAARRRRLVLPGAGLLVLLAALVAAAAPLFVYATTLALFGAVHALVELRYVDQRFGVRFGGVVGVLLVLLLVAVAALRALQLAGGLPTATGGALELGLVALLALLALPFLAVAPAGARALGGLVVLLFVLGAATAPLATLVVLAFLHNLTPVAFLAERLQGPSRRRAMLACGVVFGVVPVLIAMGGARALLAPLGLAAPDLSLLPTGPARTHLGVFVPPGLREAPFALDLFASAAFLQAMHYAVVILVLPRLGPGSAARPRLAWPRGGVLVAGLAGLAVLSLVGFTLDFGEARAVYGVLAAVHAWIEVPVLLVALAPRPGPAVVAS